MLNEVEVVLLKKKLHCSVMKRKAPQIISIVFFTKRNKCNNIIYYTSYLLINLNGYCLLRFFLAPWCNDKSECSQYSRHQCNDDWVQLNCPRKCQFCRRE